MAEILIVDDEQNFRAELKEILAKAGYDADEAAGGTEAIEMLQSSCYDAMLLDIIMPGLHGLDVIVKTHEVLPELPIIVIATKKEKLLVDKALKNGARGVIWKPFDAEQARRAFDDTLAEYLKERQCKQTLDLIDSFDQSLQEFEKAAANLGAKPIWENLPLMQKSVDMIARYLQVDKVSLSVVDNGKGILQPLVASGYELSPEQMGERKIGEGPAGWVAAEKKPLLVKNISGDERFAGAKKAEGRYKDSSFICAPLKIKNEVAAVICANDKVTRKPFTEQDLFGLSIFASQMALVLDRSRMARSLDLENQKMALGSKLNEILVNEVEPEHVFEKTTGLAREMLRCAASYLLIKQEDGDDYDFVSGANTLGKIDHKFSVASGVGITGAAIAAGAVMSVSEIAEDEMFNPEADGKILERPSSLAAAPLIIRNQVLGLIVCLNKVDADAFSTSDEEALKLIAESCSVALKNAWLHKNLILTIDQVAEAEREVEGLRQKLSKAYVLIEALKKKVK